LKPLNGLRVAIARWSIPLRVVASVGVLGVVFAKTDLVSMLGQLVQFNMPMLLTMLAFSYAAWIVNSYRFQLILAAYGVNCNIGELFRLNMIAVFYGLVLPGQVSGEVLKAVRLAGRTGAPRIAYASVFLDRMYGLIGLAILGGLAVLVGAPDPEWRGTRPAIVSLALVALGGIAVVAFPTILDRFRRSFARRERIGRGIFLANLMELGGRRPSARLVMTGCVLSLASQGLLAAIHWGVALAIGVSVSPFALTWILAVATIVGMFPISLAGLGVREATYVGLLSLFGVPAGAALSLSLVMFAILVALGLTGGILDLFVRDRATRAEA
jgi:uncharacterized protein (TIRG00374 family)